MLKLERPQVMQPLSKAPNAGVRAFYVIVNYMETNAWRDGWMDGWTALAMLAKYVILPVTDFFVREVFHVPNLILRRIR